jgi:hypothetical protein
VATITTDLTPAIYSPLFLVDLQASKDKNESKKKLFGEKRSSLRRNSNVEQRISGMHLFSKAHDAGIMRF